MKGHFFSTNVVKLSDDGTSVVEVLRVETIRDRGLKITDKMLSDFVDNYKKNSYGTELQVNLGHDRDGEAAGWIKDLFINPTNSSQLMASIEWTTMGLEKLKNKLYKFVSAEFAEKWTDANSGKIVDNVFLGLALTNIPAMKGQSPIVLSEEIKLINNHSMNKLKELLKKLSGQAAVTATEKEYLREKYEALSEEEQAEVKDEVGAVEAKPEEVEKEESTEEKKVEAKTEAPKTEELSEKVSTLSEELAEEKQKNQALHERIDRQDLNTQFEKTLLLSEDNTIGFVKKSQSKVVDFMMGLSQKDRKGFMEILSEMKAADLSTKGSTDVDTDRNVSATVSDADKKKAQELAELRGIEYHEALAEVYAEQGGDEE